MATPRFAGKPAPYRGFGSEIIRFVGHTWLRAFGWRIRGDWPSIDKAVLVAAPHTSNWDGFHMLAAAAHYRIKLRWMGKDSLGKGPLGWIARRAGLVPVDRSGGKDMVGQAARAFDDLDTMILAVAPEGTRSYTAGWKSGFYHIAHSAGVPVLMSVLDYKTHTITVSGPVETTGDFDTDIAKIRAPYADAMGRRPGGWEPTEDA
ncbi:MAG: 1-acyl-sn-glycerol-3-phosphate acyltransferase [Pseudomonadota bacterium]